MSSISMIVPISISRRGFLGAAAAIALSSPLGAAERKRVLLELAPDPDQPAPFGRFRAVQLPRLVRGEPAEVTVRNTLSVPVNIGWRGLDGAPERQSWLGAPPIAPGATATFASAFEHAGTLLCEARAAGGALISATPIVVAETESQGFDLDEAFLVESRPTSYLVNQRRTPLELTATSNARLRLRLVNGARSLLAMQMQGLALVVIALDSQPCEPFVARDARVVLAPGTRIDVAVDVTGASGAAYALKLDNGKQSQTAANLTVSASPPARATALPSPTALPSNGLPERLALATALRVDLRLDQEAGWTNPQGMSAATAPMFTVKRGRTVVIALANPTERARVFHLNGHHARLLDKLDDGWKPFWIDTIAVPPQQTLRLAFAAEHVGTYLLETSTLDADGPIWMRSYRVVA